MDPVLGWIGIFLCLSQSAMFSGLNLACFSISRIQLEIMASQNDKNAIKLLNLRRDSNFLLTTVLWGNVGVNTLLALLSGSVLGGVAAFLFSTVFITVFAEIFPQAYFSRNALRIAGLLSPGLRFYQFVLYPVAKPTAKILDLWLGPEGVHYMREEMLKQYILRSMVGSGSEVGTFEGKGAVNFLALDSRRVGEEGQVVDPESIINLPEVDGRLEIPGYGGPNWDSFVQRVQRSGKRWIILTGADERPHLLLNANHFLRMLFSAPDDATDPHDYCVKPVVTTNPQDTLERVLMSANLAQSKSPDKGVILYWGSEMRIISHSDVLRRLFEGVFLPAANSMIGG
jgi:metal transporter CNNM